MNINDLVANNAASLAAKSNATSTASKGTGAVTAASQQFAKVDKRLQADVDTTTAKLSKFGLLKSAVASSQTVAKGLSALPATASSAQVTTAMGNFFNAYNDAITAAKVAATVPGSSGTSQSANRVINDLKRALPTEAVTQDAMKKLGLSIQPDGTMAHDVKKFAAALTSDAVGTRAALSAIGKKIDAVATKELASAGPVDAEISSLTQRNATLVAQQKAMKALKDSIASAPSNSFAGFGLAAYQNNSRGF
jgi:hypothetical protein